MADFDNDRNRETVVVTDRPKKSVWSWLLPLLVLLALLVGLYILFSPENEDASINTPDTVNIDTPNADVDAPDVDVPDVDADVDVNRTDDGNNTAQ